MRYISFDVATKSLAVAVVTGAPAQIVADDLNEALARYKAVAASPPERLAALAQMLTAADKAMGQRMRIEYLRVIDLIPGKKLAETTAAERTFALHNYLQSLEAVLEGLRAAAPAHDTRCLIEYQMGPNDKSRAVSAQIMLHCMRFVERYEDVVLVGPTLKNKLYFAGDALSHYAHYVAKYRSNYTANKAHTKYLLQRITALTGQTSMLAGIAKKNMDDAADAVCMCVVHMKGAAL